MRSYLLLALFDGFVWWAAGYQMYQSRIPNGNRVPNPCSAEETWPGVGHQNQQGTGARNPFGRDFKAQEYTWTECLCRRDSDGDGRSNGEELGDPDCQFIQTGQVDTVENITHPGICEPVTDFKCAEINKWLECEENGFSCPHLSDPDVLSFTMRLDETEVPATETTYMYQTIDVDVPANQSYHLIAFVPKIDNANVVHHIVVFGCPDTDIAHERANECRKPSTSSRCNDYCTTAVAVWSFGMAGQCFHQDFGFKIGRDGMKTFLMEVHWNNPGQVSTWKDSSGLTFYYTPSLRPYSAGSTFIGPTWLALPPHQSSVIQTSVCPGECTETMMGDQEKIYIPFILPHMHSLGRRLNVTVTRVGTQLTEVVLQESHYSYDNPRTHMFDPPLEIYPGDEITVACDFATTTRNEYTYYGGGSSEEMCFALSTYYPLLTTFGDCNDRGVVYCGYPRINIFEDEWEKCWKQTSILDDRATIADGLSSANCDVDGLVCTPSCKTYLEHLRETYPDCLNIRASSMMYKHQEKRNADTFIKQLISCDEWTGPNSGDDTFNDMMCPSTQGAGGLSTPASLILGCLLAIIIAIQ